MIQKALLSAILFLFFAPILVNAQDIQHADPVYEDLTTELGADKGMNEVNINFGYRELKSDHHTFLTQLEYEFAPIDNLGFELLLPFTIYFPNPVSEIERPGNGVEFLQWTGQYTFLQSARHNFSLAFGLENIFESSDPYVSPQEEKDGFSIDNIGYTPFLIVAKNWQEKFFLLFKGGTELDHNLEENSADFIHQLHSSLHYSLSEEKENYVGVELNKNLEDGDFEMFVRPQLILELSDSFNLGATIGIPVEKPDTRWSTFVRLAYEF